MEIEHALVTDQDRAGVSLDFAKAFDSLLVDIVFGIARRMGLSEAILVPLEGMHSQLVRHFKVGRMVGTGFCPPTEFSKAARCRRGF